MFSALDKPLERLIGDRSAKAMAKVFGFHTAGDLLENFPRRYARHGELTPIKDLPIGEHVTLLARVVSATSRRMNKRAGEIQEITVTDGTHQISITFFKQPWRLNQLTPGTQALFAGKVGFYGRKMQLTHPECQLLEGDDVDEDLARAWAEKPIPIYPASASMPSWKISKAVQAVLASIDAPADPLAESWEGASELSFTEALKQIHEPANEAEYELARGYFRALEALSIQTISALRKKAVESTAASVFPREGELLQTFQNSLPFTLTEDQQKVADEISTDLEKPHPMQRLLQGEVGSGKTVIAVMAMLQAAQSGAQAAMIAPTELLANQHFRTIVKLLGPDLAAEINPVLITGSMGQAERKRAALSVVSGTSRLVIGTHALFSDKTQFFDLGLLVIDEQHRFGVEQRERLRAKGEAPHLLVLSATPIPRTVAIALFGDLEISTIRTLPSNRKGVETHVVPLFEKPNWESRIWARSREEIDKGRQVFVVCPAIDPTEVIAEEKSAQSGDGGDSRNKANTDEIDFNAKAEIQNVTETAAMLRQTKELQDVRIAEIHGQMSGEERDEIMAAFTRGEIKVLVATTVIEVGVDVPNASTMVILDADRFGIAQLHQLRGRVGRGEHPGLALLVTHAEPGSLARERIEAVASSNDGFELAQMDLELRGEGNILGASQSGAGSSLKLLRITKDTELIQEARDRAFALVDDSADLAKYPALKEWTARVLDEEQRQYLLSS
ncbi:MAG: ATP-dependent DNA helicase RecG [Microbacteriaceae bacterium]|nr:ATP-dependent DNA helicase RecG [Microbacteriaceae bacterium]